MDYVIIRASGKARTGTVRGKYYGRNRIKVFGMSICLAMQPCVRNICSFAVWKQPALISRQPFSTSQRHGEIRKLARLRVVDNSAIGRAAVAAGKPPRCIHVYNKNEVGHLGDKILVAIKGQKKRGYLVGLKQKQKANVARFDSNNIVLVEDNGMPTGTRIKVPVPSVLRGKGGDFTKLLALATKFV